MPVSESMRARGIGGTDIAAILGLDPRKDAFGVYCDKLGLIKRPLPTPRMKRGKYFERGVIEWYEDVTNTKTVWFDETVEHPSRPWQVVTPDAFVTNLRRIKIGGVDAKTVGIGAAGEWGPSGSIVVPAHIELQCQWSCSTTGLPWWDVAAIFGLDEMRIYRIYFDPEIEAVCLEEAERFWKDHIQKKVAPTIGRTEAASRYLKERFPRNKTILRPATEEEETLLLALKITQRNAAKENEQEESLKNEVRLAIGDSDGLTSSLGKVTWKKDADSYGTDYEALSRDQSLLIESLAGITESAYRCPEWVQRARNEETDAVIESLKSHREAVKTGKYRVVTREGPRKLVCRWS